MTRPAKKRVKVSEMFAVVKVSTGDIWAVYRSRYWCHYHHPTGFKLKTVHIARVAVREITKPRRGKRGGRGKK